MERIHKLIAASGLCSRRQAEKWIVEGRVCCNGQMVTLGQCAGAEDLVTVDGVPLPEHSDYVYLMLHKPKGYVTTLSDEKGRKNAAQLVQSCGQRVYPVGRLDMDSEGLLLFTNDGDLANKLMHPRNEVNKVYHVWVKNFSLEGLALLGEPMKLDGYQLRTPDVKVLEHMGATAILEMVIHEGRNRQVRRMCAYAGMTVTRLVRVAEGSLQLKDLPAGTWRFLSESEIFQLKNEI